MATEAGGGGTPDLGLFLGVSGFIGIFGVGFMSGGGGHGWGAKRGGEKPSQDPNMIAKLVKHKDRTTSRT